MAEERKNSGSDDAERKDSSSDEKQKDSSNSKDKETSWMRALLEDQKMHGMIVAVGIGLAVLIAFVTFTLFTAPPHQTHTRHKPPPQPAVREYTIRDHSQTREEVPAERRHVKKPSPDDEEETRRRKVQLAPQQAVAGAGHKNANETAHPNINVSTQAPGLSALLLPSTNHSYRRLEDLLKTGSFPAEPNYANENRSADGKVVMPLNVHVGAQMVLPSLAQAPSRIAPLFPSTNQSYRTQEDLLKAGPFPAEPNYANENRTADGKLPMPLHVQVGAQMVVPSPAQVASRSALLLPSTNQSYAILEELLKTGPFPAEPNYANENRASNGKLVMPLNVQVGAQMVVPPPAPRKPGRPTPPPRRDRSNQMLHEDVGVMHAAEAKSSALEPTDTLPPHPVVCVVYGSATAEVSYPHDGLCDAIIFNKVFYHSGQVSVAQGENHTYQEFLEAAAKSKLTAYMVATDRYFAVYETIPAAPSLEALRKENVRGFGFLGIRVQSAQGDLLEQHTRLLRSQVQDLSSMLKEVEVTDSVVFLGVTTEEHMFKDPIVTSALKSLVNSVQVHLLIIESHQLKHDDCLASPITSWNNASGIAFDEPQAVAAWMTESGMRPALAHTAVAFSSWIPAMKFLRSADVTVETGNGTRRCFVFSLSPYDKLMCSQPRRYHNVSDMYFAKDEAMQGVYVYDDADILKEKVMNVRRAMSATTTNVGWAFYGIEYESDDAGQCGRRYDRIPAVKTALRTLRGLRTA